MKTKKLKKLALNKLSIAVLDRPEQEQINGKGIGTSCDCPSLAMEPTLCLCDPTSFIAE